MSDRLQEIRARLDAFDCAKPAEYQEQVAADLHAHARDDIAWLLRELKRARRSGEAWRGLARRLKTYKDESPWDERPAGYHRQAREARERAAKRQETQFDVALLGGAERVERLRDVWKYDIKNERRREAYARKKQEASDA